MANPGPTMRDVARAAAVSTATVSLALRGDHRVAATTRRRIEVLARRLGYHRDPLVARLMAQLPKSRRGHAPTLAFVTDHDQPFGQMAATQDISCLTGAIRQARLMGYRIEEFQVTGAITGPRLSQILWNRGIEGLLIGPLRSADSRLDLDWARFSIVAIGFSLNEPYVHRVSNNQFLSIMLAMRSLYARGYRRIGLASSNEQEARVKHAWEAGYTVACRLRGIQELHTPHDLQDVEALLEWIAEYGIEVVLCGTGVEKSAMEQLGAHCNYASLQIHPSMKGISGIDQQWERLGAAAVDFLVSRIHAAETGLPAFPTVLQGDGKWIDGDTARRLDAATGAEGECSGISRA